jgi:hypothetical protein
VILLPNRTRYTTEVLSCYWLLLRGGIVQSVPCTATISDLFNFPIWVLIIPDSSTRALTKIPADTPSSESRETWWWILPTKHSSHTPQDSLTCRKILRNGVEGFTSPLKKVVLRMFIALKKPLSLAESEPANLGSSGKHDNHQTPRPTMLLCTAHQALSAVAAGPPGRFRFRIQPVEWALQPHRMFKIFQRFVKHCSCHLQGQCVIGLLGSLTGQSSYSHVIRYLQFYISFIKIPVYILPEDGNHNVCRNVGKLLTFDVAHPRKPKLLGDPEIFGLRIVLW